MKNRRNAGRSIAAGLSALALVAGLGWSAAGTANATQLPNHISTSLPGLSKAISIAPIDLSRGARRIGLASGSIFIQSSNQGTANVKMLNPEPYARIVPITGDPYIVSAGELAQNFTALLGPSPALGISYGEGSRQRSLTFTDSVSAPVYDPIGQSITFQASGILQPISEEKALVTFIATDPASRPSRTQNRGVKEIISRPGAFDPASVASIGGRSASITGRDGGQADTTATYTYDPTSFGSPGAPPTILSATQSIYSGTTASTTSTSATKPSCITYDPNSTSTGGTIVSAAQLTTESTSSEVSQTVNAGTSASMKYGGLKTSMSASYTGTTSQDSASVYAVANVATLGQATTLAPALVKNMNTIGSISDAVSFIASCGDQAATSYTTGAAYKAVLQMQTTSQSNAQTLAASLSASYKSPGTSTTASGSFSATVASNNTVQNVNVTELCIGPASCTSVPGYTGIDSSSVTNALNSFNADFTAMTSGLAGACTPSSTNGCVVQLTYAPIENLVPSTVTNSATVKSLVSNASNGVYWMLTNAQNWANEYQSLATAYSQAATYQANNIAKYTLTTTQLNTQASSYQTYANNLLSWAGKTCNGANAGTNAGGNNCLSYMVGCSNYVLSQGTNASACLPSAVSGFSTLADPSTLSGPTLVTPPQTCNDAVPGHAMTDNQSSVTLYLGGVQAVSYSVWCFWTNNVVTTYIQLSKGTSNTDQGTTSYSYAQIDPLTGTMYAVPGPYPSNSVTGLQPSCPTTTTCAPLGYVELKNGTANTTRTFTVTLPANLGFANTTSHQGSGNSTVTTPKTPGVVSNSWSISLSNGGTDLLEDKNFPGTGITKLVPLSSSYTFMPTGIAPTVTPVAATACALSSSGSMSSNGDASSNVSNQTLGGPGPGKGQGGGQDGSPGYVNGVTGACVANLAEWNYKNPGKSAWYDSTWYVNSEWGPLFPTFICGTRDNSSGDLQYKIGADYSGTGGNSVSTQWYAVSGGSKADMSITIQFDNVNTPLKPDNTWHYVGGTCPYNSTPLQGSK